MPISSINKSVGNAMSYTTKRWFSNLFDRALKEPAKYSAAFMVTSLISKDAVNCAFYTYQSYNNKKIPEDKRKFVAALDFMNGVINVVGQITSFMLFEKFVIPKFIKGYTGFFENSKANIKRYEKTTSTFAPDNVIQLTGEVIDEGQAELEKIPGVDVAKLKANLEGISKGVIKELGHESSKVKDLKVGLTLLVGYLATLALIKRTMSPLIATPFAEWYKKHSDSKTKTAILEPTDYQVPYENESTNITLDA